MDYRVIETCRVCKSDQLTQYLDLGNLPLANGLIASPNQPFNKYPLKVLFCNECGLSQLSIVVDPKILYTNYPYRSSISETFSSHCYFMGKKLRQTYFDKWSQVEHEEYHIPQPTLIDIGSNDGCLMHEFKRNGFKVLYGFEPDRRFIDFVDQDITVFDNFFSIKSVAPLKRLANLINADFITATNVLAHVDDLNGFLEGVSHLLNETGVFVVEVPHALQMILWGEFDTIYHEHLSYFLMKPLQRIFESNGLHIFDVEQYPIHGGSIRLYACKDDRPINPSIANLIETETARGMYKLETYLTFASHVENTKKDLNVMLSDKKVIGFGASAKGSTLLNYCDIHLDYIIDDTPEKQGKFIPGCNIPIKAYDYYKLVKTEYILLLAWNFAGEIIEKMNNSGYDGKWIIPIPEVKVI
jgi:SAM-dependent methyltransferase